MAADAYSLGVTLAGDIRSKHRYPGQLRRIAAGRRHFARVMALHQRDWKEEYLYWQDKGWIA
jgi:hypothetical protein